MHVPKTFLAIALALLGTAPLPAQMGTPGIHADFETSLGAFTASLDWERAPQTVANFVSLAEGSRAWLDFQWGQAERTPFYDGIRFHRIVKGFVIQGGSPAGDGSDGPGYSFQDEIATGLGHDAPYILSMANSGPNSNGSQFFITLAATPHLDGKHSAFGSVVTGRDVVDAIGMVEVDEEDRPVESVVIERVIIRRSGEAASAFDVAAQGLPTVTAVPLRAVRDGLQWKLAFPQRNNANYRLFHSRDLADWETARIRLNTSPPDDDFSVELIPDAGGVSKRFYRLVEIAYPDDLETPESVADGDFIFTITSHGWQMTASLDDTGQGGVFVMNGTPPDQWSGAITRVEWEPHPYRGILFLQFEMGTIVPARLQLVFAGAGGGTFRGTLFTANLLEIFGTFTVERAD